ncbi:MAG: hypothetical protein QM537_02335 [Candidatus Symbiobacter sp.]|nr:hypothetical protein [Candidatus Symbiobacter sp.]
MTAIKFAEYVDQSPKIQPKGEIYPLGNLKQNWIEGAKRHGIEIETPHIAVRDQDIAHTFRDAKKSKDGDKAKDTLLPKDWYKNLPHHLHHPDAVLLDTTHPEGASLLLIYKGKDKAHKLVVRLNYTVRKHRRVSDSGGKSTGVINIIGSGREISNDLTLLHGMIGKGYVVLEGSL